MDRYDLILKAKTRKQLEEKYLAFCQFFSDLPISFWATYYQFCENNIVYFAYAITIEK